MNDLDRVRLDKKFVQAMISEAKLEGVPQVLQLLVLGILPRNVGVQAEDLVVLRFTNCERRAFSIAPLMEGLCRKVVLAAAIKQVEKPLIRERAENDCLLLRVTHDERVNLVGLAEVQVVVGRDGLDWSSFVPVGKILQDNLVELQFLNPKAAATSHVEGHALGVLLGDRVVLVSHVALVQNTEPTRHDELLTGAQDRRAVQVRVFLNQAILEMEPERSRFVSWLVLFVSLPRNVGVKTKNLIVGLYNRQVGALIVAHLMEALGLESVLGAAEEQTRHTLEIGYSGQHLRPPRVVR